MTTKSSVELYYVEEFLKHLRLEIIKVVSRDKPDAYVTTRNGAMIDIELTKYFLDGKTEGSSESSAVRRHSGNWDKVINAYYPLLKAKPLKIGMSVRLRDGIFIDTHSIAGFARELFAFAEAMADRCQNRFEEIPPDKFLGLSLLEKYAAEITTSPCNVIMFPTCYNISVGHIGIVPTVLKRTIADKNDCANEWRKGATKWLLISATGECVTSRGGPFVTPDRAKEMNAWLVSQKLTYDRVFFWERVRDWSYEFITLQGVRHDGMAFDGFSGIAPLQMLGGNPLI